MRSHLLTSLLAVSAFAACTQPTANTPAPDRATNPERTLSAQAIVTYAANTTDFANPERGFYADSESYDTSPNPLTATGIGTLIAAKNAAGYKVSLIHRSYFLPGSINKAHLDAGFINALQSDLNAARDAGVKLILRFAYRTVALVDCAPGDTACIAKANAERDPSKATILEHLEDLRPTLTGNADVIAYVDAGLIGTYGEWAFADDQGVGSLLWGFNGKLQPDPQYGYTDGTVVNANTQAIIEKFLDVLPGTRAIAIRNPAQRVTLLQGYPSPNVTAPGLQDAFDPRTWNPAQTTITDASAFQDTNLARLGAYNDCFLASSDDAGTYYYGNYPGVDTAAQIAKEKDYLSANNLYVPMGGETCALNTEISAANFPAYARKELRKMRWSSLNTDYNTAVLTAMGSTLNDAKRHLGYRFALLSSSLPQSAMTNQNITVQFQVRNDGYAPPYNPRNLEVVFTKTGSAPIRRNVTLNRASGINTDPRFWKPATLSSSGATTPVTHTVNATIAAPPSSGTYQVWLNLPDPLLPNNPRYSIRLAYNGTWNASTGFNPLGQTITVR